MEAKLVVVGGKANMGEVKLRLPMTIGRGSKADLIISHPTVSRIHCELSEVDGALVVRDNNSSNGTFLDDEQVKQSVVKPGQILKIGPLSFRAEYELSAKAAKTAKPKPAADNAGLAATTTMTFEELMGDDASSVVTTPPTKPAAKAKPEVKHEVAKAKAAPEAPKKKPAAAAPTVDEEAFDFGKEIEFVDDAGLAEPPKAAAPAAPPAGAPTIDEGDFDFLADLGEPEAPAAPAAPEAKVELPVEPKPQAKSEPVTPPTIDKSDAAEDFDFLADLGAPAAPGTEPIAAGEELSSLVEPPDEKFRKHAPTETVDFDFLGGFKAANADSLAPESTAPAAEEAAPTDEAPLFDEAAAVEEPIAGAPAAPLIEPGDEAFDIDELVAKADALNEKIDEAIGKTEEIDAPQTTEAAKPEVEPDFDFLADEPAAAPEAGATEPEPAAETPVVEELAPATESVAAEAEAWSFDVESAAETTTQPAAEPEPAAAESFSFTPPQAAEPTTEDAAFDFLADETPPKAAAPAAEAFPSFEEPPSESPKSSETEATVEFRADEFEEPAAPAPAFDFAPSEESAEPAAESPFAVDASSPTADEANEAPPAVAPAAPIARAPAAKKPSFLDKVKTLFSFAAKKKTPPAKAKSTPAAKPSFAAGPAKEQEAVSPFGGMAIAPPSEAPIPLVDAPIPLSDEPINLTDETDAPAAAPETTPAADDFAVDDFLAEMPSPEAPPAEAPPAAAAATDADELSPTIDAFSFNEELAAETPAPQANPIETFTVDETFTVAETAAAEEPTAANQAAEDEAAQDVEAFDFLAEEPAAETPAAETPAVEPPAEPQAEMLPVDELAFDVAAPETAGEEPTVAAPQAWSDDGIPLADDWLAESKLAAAPGISDHVEPSEPVAADSSMPEAESAPSAEEAFDFGSFLDEPAAAAKSETPTADEAPAIATPPAAEAEMADEIFGFDVEPSPTASADLPAPEPTIVEPMMFDAAAPTAPTLEPDVPQAAGTAADPDFDAFAFEPDAAPVAAQEEPAFGEFDAPKEAAPAEAEPAMAEAAMPTTEVAPAVSRVRSIDVDARLTASHRTLARLSVRGPRIEVPHMEPDLPAGRTFNRTGRRAAAAAAETVAAPQATTAEALAAPLAAAVTTSYGDVADELPPVSPPDDFGDTPNDDFNFLGEPSAATDAAVADEPPVESTPMDFAPQSEAAAPEAIEAEGTDPEAALFAEAFFGEARAAEAPAAESPAETTPAAANSAAIAGEPADDAFDFFDLEMTESAAAAAPASETPSDQAPAAAPPATDEAFDFSFLEESKSADEAAAPAPEEAAAKKKDAAAKTSDQELDDFFNDLGMG